MTSSASNPRSEEHTSELQSHDNLVCRLLLEKKKHNKTRAEVSHASPLRVSVRKLPFRSGHSLFKPVYGSSRCVELNHMLHRLCGPPSIPLSFSLAAVLPRRGPYCVSAGPPGCAPRRHQCPSFTAWTTRVSNPVCPPRCRA